MAKIEWQQGFELKLGEMIGAFEGLKSELVRLNGDLRAHVKAHTTGWFWAIPTIISLITLIVFCLHFWTA